MPWPLFSPRFPPSPIGPHPLSPHPLPPSLFLATPLFQVSDDFVAPVTLGVGPRAQTFLLVADTGSSALAVVGDPKLGCLRYLDTSDRCDKARHVECLYGSGGWRGVDCHREVTLGGLSVSGYELAAVTWEESFLICPHPPPDAPHPLRHDMLVEGIFGPSSLLKAPHRALPGVDEAPEAGDGVPPGDGAPLALGRSLRSRGAPEPLGSPTTAAVRTSSSS